MSEHALEKPKKVKVITHSDLDGHGPPILITDFYLSLNSEVHLNIEHISLYEKVNDAVLNFIKWKDAASYDAFYITDLSVTNTETAEALDVFAKAHPNIMIHLIDHHKSALWLNQYDWAQVTVEDAKGKMHSATDLVYDFLTTDLAPRYEQALLNEEGRPTWQYMNHTNASSFADIVRSYDTWAWQKDPDNKHKEQARDFNQLFYLLGGRLFVQRMALMELSIAMQPHEKMLLEVDNRRREHYLKKKKHYVQEIALNDTDTFAFVEAESEKNDVCDMMGEMYPDAKFVVVRDHEKIGFRVRHGDYQVHKLAECFEGGGHAAAAGGKIRNPHAVSNNRLFDKITKYYNQLLEEQTV